MTIPASLVHRVKGSLLDRFFRTDFTGNRQIHKGRVFIERDPTIFRLVLKWLRSWGTMDCNQVRLGGDDDLFEKEMLYWLDMRAPYKALNKNVHVDITHSVAHNRVIP